MRNVRHPNGSYSIPEVSRQARGGSLSPKQNKYQIGHGPSKNCYFHNSTYPETPLHWAIPNPRSYHESTQRENF